MKIQILAIAAIALSVNAAAGDCAKNACPSVGTAIAKNQSEETKQVKAGCEAVREVGYRL